MRLLDANLLLYAYHSGFPQHDRAHSWLDEKLNGPEPLALPWPTLLAFTRLVTNPKVFTEPVSIQVAWTQALEWLSSPCTWIPSPSDRHAEILGQLLLTLGAGANNVPDAHLAALAMEHGLILCSADAGFARFGGLRHENPLSR